MKKFFLLFFISIFACTPQPEKNNAKWIQLFNGKDLSGWQIKISGHLLNKNYKNTFLVEDGLLKVNYSNYDNFEEEFGHIFYKDKFSQYKLRVEYRFTGEQVPGGPGWAFKNSGVMFHSQSAESMGLDQDFPVSIEAQFLGGRNEGDRPTANLCTPGTHVVMNDELLTEHCFNSKSKTFRGKEWVTVEMVVLADSIIHHIVGSDTVLSYTKPQIDASDIPEGFLLQDGMLLKEGYIALQAESHPIEFRKVELLDLSQK